MGPIEELETRIRESYGLVCEYERQLQTANDPRDRRRWERERDGQWLLIRGYLEDYLGRVEVLRRAVPEDIRQIAAHFPDLTVRVVGTEVEFVNREQELDRLAADRLRAARSPYALIGAPAGYGKSYLLKRVLTRIQSNVESARAWSCRYVDLGAADEDQVAWMARSLVDRPECDVPTLAEQIIKILSTPDADGRRGVLLLFDTVERLQADAAQWLYALFHTLYTRTRVGGRELVVVRVIVAGRAVEAFWAGYERFCAARSQGIPLLLAPQRIWLSPFDAYPIQELVWALAQRAQVTLDDQFVAEVVQEVQHLSGGHPAIIRALVVHLADQAFAIGAVREYFGERQVSLVQTYVKPVAEALLADLPVGLRAAIQTLSVFRRFNANTVQRLIRLGELPSDTDEIALFGALERAHILIGPTIREPFYRDHLVRRVLTVNAFYASDQDAARYRQLNALALDLYADWIRGDDLADSHLKSAQRLYSVVEWLFHALQGPTMTADELCRALHAHIHFLSGGEQVARLIADEIRQDDEICYLIRRQFGDAGVEMVCDALCVCREGCDG